MFTWGMKALSFLTAFALVMLVALILYDASMRYLFAEGSTALQELEWHLFDVVILLSIAYTLGQNAHVRVDIFYEHFTPKMQNLIDIVSLLFFVLPLSLLLVYISVGFVEMSYVQNEASCDPGGLSHRWLVKSLLPLSFIFVILAALQRVLQLLEQRRVL